MIPPRARPEAVVSPFFSNNHPGMRVGPDQAFHLSYCTNIHPGESWPEVAEQLERHVPAVREQVGEGGSFGIGLRLANQAAEELLEGDALDRFADWLADRDCYVYTINGFPYGRFHGERVKDEVYRPDWREPERVAYTIRLARILAELLPEGVDGSISTSPLSYKRWLGEEEYDRVKDRASRNLSEVVGELARIEEETGREIHLAIEPEPDCLIENTEETVGFFEDHLLPIGAARLSERRHASRVEAERLIRRHVGICYDTCHIAVEYEEPEDLLAAAAEAGVRISKVQLSSALRIASVRPEIADRLRPFAEDIYLHQVLAVRDGEENGPLRRYPDLGPALDALEAGVHEDAASASEAEAEVVPGEEWRIHYHVPIFVNRYEDGGIELGSTQSSVERALDVLLEDPEICSHLEIETYTWGVLPERLKEDVDTSIAREYEWVLDRLG